MKHYVGLALIMLLIYSAVQRARTGVENRDLFWANVIVPITIFSSLPPVYYFLDPLLGNINLVNLLAHIGIVVAGWLASRSLGRMGAAFRGETFNTRWFSPIWLIGMLALLTYSFIHLGLGYSNRGLDSKSGSLLYGIYHGVTYLGLSFGAPYVAPRLRKIIAASRFVRQKIQFSLFYFGYFAATAAGVLHLISPHFSQVRDVREICIYATGFTLTLAFVMVTLDKKALMQAS